MFIRKPTDALLTTINTNIGNRALILNVYTKTATDALLTIISTNLGNCALILNVYSKSEINDKFTTSNNLINANISSVKLGEVFRLRKPFDDKTFSIDRYTANYVAEGSVWKSLFAIVYDTITMRSKFYVDDIDLFSKNR